MAVFREHGQGKTGSEETSKSAREGKSSILGRESGKKSSGRSTFSEKMKFCVKLRRVCESV